MVKFPDVWVDLFSIDSNAFSIIGTVRRALKAGGATTEELDEFMAEATSGDYDQLLRTVIQWVNIGEEED